MICIRMQEAMPSSHTRLPWYSLLQDKRSMPDTAPPLWLIRSPQSIQSKTRIFKTWLNHAKRLNTISVHTRKNWFKCTWLEGTLFSMSSGTTSWLESCLLPGSTRAALPPPWSPRPSAVKGLCSTEKTKLAALRPLIFVFLVYSRKPCDMWRMLAGAPKWYNCARAGEIQHLPLL